MRWRPRRYVRRLGLGLLVAVLLGACTATPRLEEPTPEERAELVWPPPPARPRLAWDDAFARPADLGLGLGFWQRTRRLMLGGPRERLVRPQGITVSAGRIVVTDPGRPAVLVYDVPAKRYTALVADARHPWKEPVSVACTAQGTLFVADARAGLFRLDPPWDAAAPLHWPGLERPVAVAVDEARDRLYVLDSAAHRLLWGALDGTYQTGVGHRGLQPGEFNYPTHLAVAPDGGILVTDAMNFRVQRLRPDGTVVNTFGQAGDGSGDFAKPKGVAVDAGGTIYVVDAEHDVVQLFDAQGRLLMWLGERGRRMGRFWLPNGIAIGDDGRIYVADSYNRRVQVFAPVPEPAP